MNREYGVDHPQEPGIYEEAFALKGGKLLRFTLSIPAGFNGRQPLPLVLALHFGGPVTPWYSKGYLTVLVEPALKELGAIIAAPDCPAQGWNNPTSEAAVIELLDHIKKHYNIDSQKILITGFSLGGIGAWHMIARHAGLFSAAVPMSAAVSRETVKRIKDTPIYIIHSKQDEIFPVEKVIEMTQVLKENNVSVHLEIIDGVSHYNTGEFTEPLRNIVPWLKNIWKNK
jgi:predicted peptidase